MWQACLVMFFYRAETGGLRRIGIHRARSLRRGRCSGLDIYGDVSLDLDHQKAKCPSSLYLRNPPHASRHI